MQGHCPEERPGPGSPFHSCGVASRPPAMAASRQACHCSGSFVLEEPIFPLSMVRIAEPGLTEDEQRLTRRCFRSAETDLPEKKDTSSSSTCFSPCLKRASIHATATHHRVTQEHERGTVAYLHALAAFPAIPRVT